jgi:hypothetical protein
MLFRAEIAASIFILISEYYAYQVLNTEWYACLFYGATIAAYITCWPVFLFFLRDRSRYIWIANTAGMFMAGTIHAIQIALVISHTVTKENHYFIVSLIGTLFCLIIDTITIALLFTLQFTKPTPSTYTEIN